MRYTKLARNPIPGFAIIAFALSACGSQADAASDGEETLESDLSTAASTQLVAQLQALTSHCTVASKSKYATDTEAASRIDICKLNGAYFWKSDMDVDCDGQSTSQCNRQVDPWYQNQTSFEQSNGQPLIASKLPYIVVPLPSARFNYRTAGIKPGAVAAVLYNGKVSFGVFGDEGPSNIIGEASYAMAKSLGINPDPANGGVDSGVTFIVFTGQAAVASPIENHTAAVTLGERLATTLVQNN